MPKKFLYLQPEYVREFICDGSKCDARCCKNWSIEIDAATREQYSQVKPDGDAQKILAHIKFNSDRGKYFVELNAKKICPFLTDEKLCRLQLTYGEKFLSATCKTYPRYTHLVGKIFERAMSLTCPVAAEKILFRDAPLTFELLEVTEDDDAKILIMPAPVPQKILAPAVDLQIAMISILQERTLTLDQRLIVLGFFLDRLDEIISDDLDEDALTKLVAAYESKKFLSEQVPRMFATVRFDTKKFFGLMLTVLEKLYGGEDVRDDARKFIDALVATLKIFPDAHGKVSATQIAANYERLADARKNFLARYSTVLENFLVNELFMNCVPWQREANVAKNFGVFVAQYKIFELLTFAASQKNLDGRDDLLRLVDWFTNQTDHAADVPKKLLELVPDDIFSTLEIFLEADG